MATATDDRFMRRAIDLASQFRTHPNPRVGAVVLSPSGEVVGEGAHVAAGEPHAEVVALAQAGALATGGTIHVTLEPCNHTGRTPPCTEALIAAGIKRVVVAMRDPDERVAGSGIARLESSGIEVVSGVLSSEAEALNEAYVHHRTTGLPLVTAKWAMTLDGSVAAEDGTARWITGDEAREDAHKLRASVDAVVVGAGTLRADNPMLDVRLDGYSGHQPRPVIVVGTAPLPGDAAIWGRAPLVVTVDPELSVPGGEAVVVGGVGGIPDPVSSVRALADLGYLSILLEGGPTVAGSWWRTGVVRKGVVYVASKVGGGAGLGVLGGRFPTISDAEMVNVISVRSLGPDQRIEFVRN